MTIKQQGGVFGRNPKFNEVEANKIILTGELIINGETITGLDYNGAWDASTNTPTLASGTGTAGSFYIVSVAGSTDLDGITTWQVGDWALFDGSVWQRVEGGQITATAEALKSTATTGKLQVTGPADATSRTMTVPDADFTAARTDASQTFNDTQTFSRGQLNDVSEVLMLRNPAGGSANATIRISMTTRTGDFIRGAYIEAINVTGASYGFDIAFAAGSNNQAASEVARITGNGKYLRFVSGSGGIQFNGDTAAANALDDYEEGQFSPYFYDDINGQWSGSVADSGYYVKVGKVVHCIGNVDWSSKPAIGGTLRVRALPFTAGNPGNPSAPNVDQNNSLGDGIQIRIAGTDFLFYDGGSLQGNGLIGTMASSGTFKFNVTYFV